jgi:hypothetical protein
MIAVDVAFWVSRDAHFEASTDENRAMRSSRRAILSEFRVVRRSGQWLRDRVTAE